MFDPDILARTPQGRGRAKSIASRRRASTSHGIERVTRQVRKKIAYEFSIQLHTKRMVRNSGSGANAGVLGKDRIKEKEKENAKI